MGRLVPQARALRTPRRTPPACYLGGMALMTKLEHVAEKGAVLIDETIELVRLTRALVQATTPLVTSLAPVVASLPPLLSAAQARLADRPG